MFGVKKKKSASLEDQAVQKENKKENKQQNIFDDWARRYRKVVLVDNKREVKSIYWFKEFKEFTQKGGRVLDFLEAKNKKLYDEYKNYFVEKITAKNEAEQDEITRCENVIAKTIELDSDLIEFVKDIKKLEHLLKKNRFDDVKNLLINYSQTGRFSEKGVNFLKENTEGFWYMFFNWYSMYKARRFLDKFVEKYTKNNVFRKAYNIFLMDYGKDVGYCLSLRINTICMFDEKTSKTWIKKKEKALNKIDKKMRTMVSFICSNNEFLNEVENSFNNTKLLEQEKEIVLKYFE